MAISPIAVIIDRFAGDRQLFWVYGRYNNTQRVRLVGLNAPEPNGHCEDERSLDRWAQHRLEEPVSLHEVRIALVACDTAPRDRYGRRWGILYADGPHCAARPCGASRTPRASSTSLA
jgi:endonuclease YncB( thermonuclease family)